MCSLMQYDMMCTRILHELKLSFNFVRFTFKTEHRFAMHELLLYLQLFI